MVMIHFGVSILYAEPHPPDLWSAQVCGALINHDTWHPSSADTWNSSLAFFGISYTYFWLTHVAHPSTIGHHTDVRLPRQLWVIILREVFLFKISAISMHVLMDPRFGKWINFTSGAKFSRCAQIIDHNQINDHSSFRGCNMLEQ